MQINCVFQKFEVVEALTKTFNFWWEVHVGSERVKKALTEIRATEKEERTQFNSNTFDGL